MRIFIFMMILFSAISYGASSKDGRIYAVVNWNTPMSKAEFTAAKAFKKGIIQNSLATVRKSLDGKKAILKWRSKAQVPNVHAKILWSGNHQQMLAYLKKNEKDWTVGLK